MKATKAVSIALVVLNAMGAFLLVSGAALLSPEVTLAIGTGMAGIGAALLFFPAVHK